MMIQFEMPDASVEAHKLSTNCKTASAAYKYSAMVYADNKALIAWQEEQIRILSERIDVYEQRLEMARSAAALLLEKTG